MSQVYTLGAASATNVRSKVAPSLVTKFKPKAMFDALRPVEWNNQQCLEEILSIHSSCEIDNVRSNKNNQMTKTKNENINKCVCVCVCIASI